MKRIARSSKHLLVSIFLVSAVHAAKKHAPLSFGTIGVEGHALPRWPKTADTLHVTNCEKGSPAFGKLQAGDIIVGIQGSRFSEHPIRAIAKALDPAEAAGGKFSLLLKSGKTVTLQLPTPGVYSPTAPFNCPKTDKLIEQAAEVLMKEQAFGSTPTRTGLLGLMATGKKEHLDAVAHYIHHSNILQIDPKVVEEYLKTGQPNLGSTGWTWGYNLIALGEYYLLTQDEKVLPAIRTYALGLARGQDGIGLWGHRMAIGLKSRRVPGYGIMNAASIPNFVGLLIAQKCGLNEADLDAAIERTYAYVADHVGKGGFPYGVHGPKYDIFNNNGTSGSAAIAMALKGDQKGASFFSKSCAPTHDMLTVGHASHFFNPLWTPLGVNLSGPKVTQEFFKRSLWYFNSKRHWKGGFPGKGRGGFFAGQALLTYCLPRKVLLLTGRETDSSIWVRDREEVDALIAMRHIDYQSKSPDELLELFDHPFSQVRVRAIAELGKKQSRFWKAGNKKNLPDAITPKIVHLAKTGNPRQRVAALKCLGKCSKFTSKSISPLLAEVVKDREESLDIRLAAVTAFGEGNCGADALPYYNDILRLTLEKQMNPDPFGHKESFIAKALLGIMSQLKTPESRENLIVDKALVYQVANQFFRHPRQKVREAGAQLIQGIELKDFHFVADSLVEMLENKDPSYHTYSAALNAPAIGVLADLRIKEGLDFLESGIFHGGGKWGFKYRALIKALPKYGAHAKPYISKFEAHPSINKEGDRFTPQWQNVVKKIRENENPEPLISTEAAKQAGQKAPRQNK